MKKLNLSSVNRKFNESGTYDTIHSGKAAYQISNHFCKWLLSFCGRKCIWTYGQKDDRMTVKLNAPDAYQQGHKNMVPIVPDKKIFFS